MCYKRIIPIAEYLTTTQTAGAITNWLKEFRKFYERQCDTKFMAHVVSDFSTAILKGFVRAFNECKEVVEYLNKCYEFMYEGKIFDCNALISLCCCHLIKNISDDAHKYYKGNGKKMTNGSLACLYLTSFQHNHHGMSGQMVHCSNNGVVVTLQDYRCGRCHEHLEAAQS